MHKVILASMISVTIALAGCESKPNNPPPAKPPAGSAPSKGDHDHKPGEDEKRDEHGGAAIELGTNTVSGMSIKASRDAGEIRPGGDAPIDVWIDGGLGNVAAVRFWIGTEDAKGSMKAKAEAEGGKWHSHAEVPAPLPPASKLWVEIEGKDGKKVMTSFELKS